MTDREALAEIIGSNYGEVQCHAETMRCAAKALRYRIYYNWVSVDDRLPKAEADVLVRYIGVNTDLVFYQVLHYFAYDEEPHFQHMLNEKNLLVTHWMPITAPQTERSEHE